MMKFVFVLCVALALMHQTQAFKVITIHKGAPPSAPAVDPSALLQGVQSAIAGKLQQVQALVGSLIQQKTALKQNALNSIQSTLGSVKSQVGSLAGSLPPPPFVIRKQIYIGAPKPAPAAPETTTAAEVDATTTSG
ncbi:uncharacterized protein LOC135958965 [Calliphora vicina]|uniref:uncharacterized protein LOC135958965 n=1 Tax=Calliphora vicina TaxID=7373 RepID=UPI00325BE63E